MSAPCRPFPPLSPLLSVPLDLLPQPRKPEVKARVPRETCRRRRTQHVPYVVGLRVESARARRTMRRAIGGGARRQQRPPSSRGCSLTSVRRRAAGLYYAAMGLSGQEHWPGVDYPFDQCGMCPEDVRP